MNVRQKMIVVAVDVSILAAICIGMHSASLDPDNFTAAFCGSFFPLFLPALAIGIVLVRLLRDRKSPAPTPAA